MTLQTIIALIVLGNIVFMLFSNSLIGNAWSLVKLGFLLVANSAFIYHLQPTPDLRVAIALAGFTVAATGIIAFVLIVLLNLIFKHK
jgi:hypothetical protein